MKSAGIQRYDYHVWANEKTLNHLKVLPEELYGAVVQSVFPSIADALAHIYRVDITWFGAVSGKSFDAIMEDIKQAIEQAKGVSLETMQELYHQLAEKYRAFLAEQDLDAVREYPHPQYGTLRASHSDIIEHVVNQGTYHRGQLGHPGVPTDYVFYLYVAQ